jgi:hypothetical protein
MQCSAGLLEVSRIHSVSGALGPNLARSVTDRNTQYFLAEASSPLPGSSNADVFWREEDLLFTGQGVSKEGQICEVRLSWTLLKGQLTL